MEAIKIEVAVHLDASEALLRAIGALAGTIPASPEEVKPETAAAEEAKPAEAAPVEAKPETAKPEGAALPTAKDVRDAIERTRQRIIGPDYPGNPEGEAYKTYYRQLTSWFKNLSATLGADKPSGLAPERRRAFIEACDAAEGVMGRISEPLPF